MTTARIPSTPGSYALVLATARPCDVTIGRRGRVRLDAPYYLYCGSAFGPGGLVARLSHHLAPVARPHWHVDYLRQAASVVALWYTSDPRRMECAWAAAAERLRGARTVPGLGASDCTCRSHLTALPRRPLPATFRRHLRVRPRCTPIRAVRVTPGGGHA